MDKSSALLKVSDVIIFSRGKELKALQVLELGARRGTVLEAQNLYKDFQINDKIVK